LEQILRGDRLKYVLFGRFLDLTANKQLVQDEVGFFKVKDNIQLADLV